MSSKIEQLQKEILQLKEDLADREASLPAHSVRAHQIMAIEELEEAVSLKEEELKRLMS